MHLKLLLMWQVRMLLMWQAEHLRVGPGVVREHALLAHAQTRIRGRV